LERGEGAHELISWERRGMKRELCMFSTNVKGLRYPDEALIKQTNIRLEQLPDTKLINKAIANYELLGRPIRPGKSALSKWRWKCRER
jgi:hypothetical protein